MSSLFLLHGQGGPPALFSCLHQGFVHRRCSQCPGSPCFWLILERVEGEVEAGVKGPCWGQPGPVQNRTYVAQPKPCWRGGGVVVVRFSSVQSSGPQALNEFWAGKPRHLDEEALFFALAVPERLQGTCCLSLPPPPTHPLLHSCSGLSGPVPGLPSNGKACVYWGCGGGRGGGWTPLGKRTVPRLRPGQGGASQKPGALALLGELII